MRGIAIGLAIVLAGAPASADVASLSGEVAQVRGGTTKHELALDARGWVVEARFAMATSVQVQIEITDDRMTSRFMRVGNVAILDNESFELPEQPTGVHTYRIEASTGRRLLLVDGQVVIDRDLPLPSLVLAQPRRIELSAMVVATSQTPPPAELAHWQWVQADTAPTGLAMSALAYTPATTFGGPFATWLFRLASRTGQIAPALAQLQLPERARACVAFGIVAAASTPRPKHYRPNELAKLPKNMPPEPPAPQIDFDLIESPRQARKPVMRRRRAPADVRAQVELFNALKAKDPAAFYNRAVEIVVNEAGFTREAMQALLEELQELAKSPERCR